MYQPRLPLEATVPATHVDGVLRMAHGNIRNLFQDKGGIVHQKVLMV